ncbi:MAG: EpsG family protein [Lachnospiraceae bacterium]|nr:EpsG family protein [Lachnospiraceae bacterium]
MAYGVQPYEPGEARWVCGRRTKKSFRNRLLIAGIFTILFALMALRFDVGNDYRQYTETAHEAYVGGYVVTEAGFNWTVRLLYGIAGGEFYELVFAAFAFVTLLFFFQAFARQSVRFAQSFFLFMTLGLYFHTFNTVRYYLALSVALFSMKYVLEKDYLKFVFWILTAALFHKSVLLVLPVYWIATFAWSRWQLAAGLAVSAVCFLGRGLILKLALMLYPSYRDTVYLEGGGSWGSVLRTGMVLGLYVWFVRAHGGTSARDLSEKQSWYRELRFYAQLHLLALVTSTFFSFLPVVTRISYYFSVSQLFMIPLLVCHIEGEKRRRQAAALIAVVCLIYFGVFLLQAHQEGVRLLPYRSWLFDTQRYTYK